jgi:hypothetical protein
MRQPGWRELGLGVAVPLAACVIVMASCGARSGLDFDSSTAINRSESARVHAKKISDGSVDQSNGNGGESCIWPPSLTYGSAEAGPAMCVAGAELLMCDVASNGRTPFDNYCVSSVPTCSAISDPSCESQCSAGEYGVLCAESTAPMASGCRLIWPAGNPDGDGFAFCCSCE